MLTTHLSGEQLSLEQRVDGERAVLTHVLVARASHADPVALVLHRCDDEETKTRNLTVISRTDVLNQCALIAEACTI